MTEPKMFVSVPVDEYNQLVRLAHEYNTAFKKIMFDGDKEHVMVGEYYFGSGHHETRIYPATDILTDLNERLAKSEKERHEQLGKYQKWLKQAEQDLNNYKNKYGPPPPPPDIIYPEGLEPIRRIEKNPEKKGFWSELGHLIKKHL